MKNNLLQLHRDLRSHAILKFMYRPFIVVFGFLTVITGIMLCFMPGQGLLTILLGIAILSSEFRWAKKLLRLGIYYKNKLIRTLKGRNGRIRSSYNTTPSRERAGISF